MGEHELVKNLVQNASETERSALKKDAETILLQANTIMKQRILSSGEFKVAALAIEVLVRLEGQQSGKGFWFRLKRRSQLRQLYLDLGTADPFGFSITKEINNDAVKLKAVTQIISSRYCNLECSILKEALLSDFPKEQVYIDSHYATFYYMELSYFKFILNFYSNGNNFPLFLTVQGIGKYTGFMLHLNGDRMFTSVKDYIIVSATGSAKKLAKVMKREFGVGDLKH